MKQPRDEILDLVRGLSALAVLAAHIRGFLFVDLAEISSPGTAVKALYFSTGVHHQAVMVFFVLSGYFVGGGVVKSLTAHRFSWRRYLLARLSRLWVVLIPALLLTLLCDQIGAQIELGAYKGEWRDAWMSGPEKGHGTHSDVGTFLGNLAFLQTVSVSVFGSNGPLWSLANEFWYYIAFPLLAGGVFGIARQRGGRFFGKACFFLAGVLLIWWLPIGISLKGFVWALGIPVWVFASRGAPMTGWRWRLWLIGGGVAFLICLALNKTGSVFGSDYMVGISFALWMCALLGPWRTASILKPVSRYLSEISYTLYVTHFPLLFLFAATILRGRQLQPTAAGFTLFALLFFACIIIATGLWWMFERRTDSVRRWISFRLGL